VISSYEPASGNRTLQATRSATVSYKHPARCCVTIGLLLALCRCQQVAAQTQPTTEWNAIHGVVINSVTHEPVSRALVFSGDNRFATLTDEQGHFELTLPQLDNSGPETTTFSMESATIVTSTYSGFLAVLMARKPGFLGLEPHRQNLNQVPVTTGQAVTIELVPEARIVGRVILPSSNASDRIAVRLYQRQVFQGHAYWNYVAAAFARSSGDFRFADLAPGTYKLLTGELMDRDPLTFDPRGPTFGYPPVYFSNATDFQSATPIQLSPGTSYQAELSPVRQPYYNVKIPINNPPADEQIEVSVSVQGRKGPGFDLGYSARDRAIEGSLPNGTYLIEAFTQGPHRATGSAHIVVNGGSMESPALSMTTNSSLRITAKIDFRLTPEADVQNAVEGQDRKGMQLGRFANVRLEPADEFAILNTPFPYPSAGAHDDEFVFDDVRPGRYWVRIECNRGYVAALTAGEIDLLRRPLSVGLGSNLTIDATLRDDGAELSGTAEALQPDPASATSPVSESKPSAFASFAGRVAWIYLVPLPESTGQFRQAPVSNGKFSLPDIAPGSYRVLAFDRPQPSLEYTNSEAMHAFDTKGEVVRLVSGQKENLTVHLIAGAE